MMFNVDKRNQGLDILDMTFMNFFFLKRCSALNIIKVLEALNNRLLEPVIDVQLVGTV